MKTYTREEVLELMQKSLNLGRQGLGRCDFLLDENESETKGIYKGGIVSGVCNIEGAEALVPLSKRHVFESNVELVPIQYNVEAIPDDEWEEIIKPILGSWEDMGK
jgi:hypothetical protein